MKKIFWSRSQKYLLVFTLVCFIVWYANHQVQQHHHSSSNTPCIVNGLGNELCGQAAGAWCDLMSAEPSESQTTFMTCQQVYDSQP